MSKVSDELKRYFNYHGIKNKEIAEQMKLQAPLISNMLNGRDSIGKYRAAQLHEIYGFNLHFLLTGEGELVPDITLQPAELKRRASGAEKAQEATAAPLPPMVDASADMVTILLGQVQQLTTLVGKMREENLALRRELDDNSKMV